MSFIVCTVHLIIKSRRLRWAASLARTEEGRIAFKNLTGKPTGKKPLGRPRREDNIGIDLNQLSACDLIHVMQLQ
jgi:hypothetical protein